MTANGALRSDNGQSIPQLLAALKASVGTAADAGVRAIAVQSKSIIVGEGARYHITVGRKPKPRKQIPLGAKTSTTTAGRTLVEGAPAGFWSIVEKGSQRTWRIERKLLGRGKYNRRAQLLGSPGKFGPRPYAIRKGQRPIGHPWVSAMTRVEVIPGAIYAPPVAKVFEAVWRG